MLVVVGGGSGGLPFEIFCGCLSLVVGKPHFPCRINELSVVAQACHPCSLGCRAVRLQIQQLPKGQDKFKANLGTLVRPCLKINREKGWDSVLGRILAQYA